jgi:TonB-linked SusC/RagA family outer membrane protein
MKKLFLLLMTVFAIVLGASAQNRSVSGVVVDATTDEPLIGASVVPVGGSSGVVTDVDGKFVLRVAPGVKEITVSYIGMKTKTVAVSDHIFVALESSSEVLNDLVVTGYGSAKKLGSVVGSVAVVSEAQFENVPTTTFVDALQGQVAGLSIMSSSGDPSSTNTNIRIRGVNSINSGNTPLFILDGAPITETVFTTLNPGDIESVTVLKDAASVAIYGSRAANGVIVITSKKGKFGQDAKITIRANYGWSQMTSDGADMMNAEQYVKYRDLIGASVSDEIKSLVSDYGVDTNWRDEIFDGSAPTYSLEGAIQGGSEANSYYISVNHMKQEGIIAQSGMRRETIRANITSKVKDWLRIGLQTNLGYTDYQTNNESNSIYSSGGLYTSNPMMTARLALPYDSPYYIHDRNGLTLDDNGKLIYGEKASYLRYSGLYLPTYVINNRSVKRNRLTINANLYEQLTPIKGLTIKAQQAVDAYDSRVKNNGFPKSPLVTPWGTSPNASTANDDGIIEGYNQQTFSRYYSFTYTNTAEYKFNINNTHNVSALIGQESIISKSNGFGVFSSGQTDIRQMLLTQGSEVTISDLSESTAEEVFNSFFFTGSYNYNERYYLDLTYRRDGSSLFAPKHRWGNFYSVGLMWNAKGESFLQDYKWLDDLRVRVSYGTTGNTSVSNYAYFGLVGSYSNPYNGGTGIGISQASNYDLTWETVKSFDLGLNIGVFDHLSADIDFYNKKTCNMLLDIPYSYTTGFDSGSGNIGSMKNTGIDVQLNGDVVKTKDWYWGLRVNFNYNRNRITELFDGNDTYTLANYGLQYKVGHDAGELYQVRYAGVDPRDGKPQWYDKDGNITEEYNEERDAVLIGKSRFAPWTGGFGTDLSWKGLALKVDFTWAAKKYMINNDRYFLENNNFGTSYNQMASMLNVWTTPGQITDIPGVGNTIQFDSHLVEDASFLRLKNVTLQYALPKSILKKARLDAVNFHVTGRNLLTFTDYTGYDPEPDTNVAAFFYPNTRQYEVGVEVTF